MNTIDTKPSQTLDNAARDTEQESYTVDDFVALGYRLQAERNAALAQRDELLAALRAAAETISALRKHYRQEMSTGYQQFAMDAEGAARAAIAKAEGT